MALRARVLALTAAAILLPACVEADLQTEVRADGSGTLGVGMKFTDKFVEIVKKMEKVDAKSDLVAKSKEGMMRKPDEAMTAAWEKAGLKVLQFENVADEKRISTNVKFEFKTLDLLSRLKEIENKDGSSPLGGLTLTRDDKGIYTLAMGQPEKGGAKGGPDIEMGEVGEGAEPKPAGGDKAGEKAEAKDAAAEAKKAGEAMAMMGELMGEMQNFKFRVALKVPGEIVDFAPDLCAKKDGTQVNWEFSFQSMMELQMAGGMEEEGMDTFRVRFRMPEGKALPESALTKGADAPKAPEEKPAPAPEGGK